MRRDSYDELNRFINISDRIYKLGWSPNYWSYRFKWQMAYRLRWHTRFPVHLDVEATDYCNLRCIMCPHSSGKDLNTGFMDFDLYRNIIDESTKYGLCSLKLNWRGESLMHKNIVAMVGYAKKRGVVEILMNTNGLLLNETKTIGLINAGIDYIIISIDGATKETYEKIRVGGNFEKLEKNIHFLCDYKRKNNLKKPLVRLQYVNMKGNSHEIDAFKKKWKGIVDYIAINDYSTRVDEADWSVRGDKPAGRACCPHPFRRMAISWDGKVTMCCGDWNMKNVLGIAGKDALFDIWNGIELHDIKELHKQEKLNDIPACRNCFVLASYKWRKK